MLTKILLVAVPLWLAATFWLFQQQTGRPAPDDPFPVLWSVPDFTLISEQGSSVSLSDLHGQVWVADFIFTRCDGPCPLMSRQMSELQEVLRARPQVRLVSISVDPDHDTPEILSSYAERWDADPERWVFLTGPKESTLALIEQGFKVGAQHVVGGQVIHGTHFLVIDPSGRVRAAYNFTDPDFQPKLLRAVEYLVQENG